MGDALTHMRLWSLLEELRTSALVRERAYWFVEIASDPDDAYARLAAIKTAFALGGEDAVDALALTAEPMVA